MGFALTFARRSVDNSHAMKRCLNQYGSAVAVMGVAAVVCLGSGVQAGQPIPVMPARGESARVEHRDHGVAQLMAQLTGATRVGHQRSDRQTSKVVVCPALAAGDDAPDSIELTGRHNGRHVVFHPAASLLPHLLNLPPPVRA